MKFIVHDVTGKILRMGWCSFGDLLLQAGDGETAIEDAHGDTDDRKHRIVDGKRIEFTPDPPPPPIIEALRASAYPPIGDQFDAIWHAMDVGVLPMVPDFYDPIAAVKAAYPKQPKE